MKMIFQLMLVLIFVNGMVHASTSTISPSSAMTTSFMMASSTTSVGVEESVTTSPSTAFSVLGAEVSSSSAVNTVSNQQSSASSIDFSSSIADQQTSVSQSLSVVDNLQSSTSTNVMQSSSYHDGSSTAQNLPSSTYGGQASQSNTVVATPLTSNDVPPTSSADGAKTSQTNVMVSATASNAGSPQTASVYQSSVVASVNSMSNNVQPTPSKSGVSKSVSTTTAKSPPKCWQCMYNSSMPKDQQLCNHTKVTCSSGQTHCVTVNIKKNGGFTQFELGCGKEDTCKDTKKACDDETKKYNWTGCSIDCCFGDYCNKKSGGNSLVSLFPLLISLLGLFYSIS